MKSVLASLIISSAAIYSFSASAIDGTVTFTGSVTSDTCSIGIKDGQDSDNSVVVLGAVQASSLAKANDTAGGASFRITVTGDEKCTLTGKTGTIRFTSMSGSVGDSQQYLGVGTAAGAAKNVGVRISDDAGNVVLIGGKDSATSYPLDKPLMFNADYIATGAATAGTVNAKAGFIITMK